MQSDKPKNQLVNPKVLLQGKPDEKGQEARIPTKPVPPVYKPSTEPGTEYWLP
jgi:hypothetical protein